MIARLICLIGGWLRVSRREQILILYARPAAKKKAMGRRPYLIAILEARVSNAAVRRAFAPLAGVEKKVAKELKEVA